MIGVFDAEIVAVQEYNVSKGILAVRGVSESSSEISELRE